MSTVPPRLGIVAETGGRGDVWRVRFDDVLATRIYLNGRTGEFVTSRNEAWVWYDFFWRLHIMDYAGGEDFNGTLLRTASVTALALVLAGAYLPHWRRCARPGAVTEAPQRMAGSPACARLRSGASYNPRHPSRRSCHVQRHPPPRR